jgi:glycosyltransferase involved in cell wall biosynthesis
MASPLVSIVVPLWNEGDNIDGLIEMLGESKAVRDGHAEAVLVNNGSRDATGALLDKHSAALAWIRPIHLAENRNYGGGILEGASRAAGEIVVFIPGDLQYDAGDLDKVVARLIALNKENKRTLVKGRRTTRLDNASMQSVSAVYTTIANTILGIGVSDVNGLPKGFHKSLLRHLPEVRMQTFVLDAQLLFTARKAGWAVEEIPVTFHARRAGVSSWSGKRIQTYLRSIRQLWTVRRAGIRAAG